MSARPILRLVNIEAANDGAMLAVRKRYDRAHLHAACISDACSRGRRRCPTPSLCVRRTRSPMSIITALVLWLLGPKP
jgi:hypothetical protein